MKIDEKMIDPGADVFYKKEFMDVVESYIDYLKGLPSSIRYVVKAEDVAIYTGDLYGYLNHINVAPYLHWTTMRLNNMFSVYEFDESVKSILIPSAQEMNRIKGLYLSNPGTVGL